MSLKQRFLSLKFRSLKEVLLEDMKSYEILLEDMNEFYYKVSSWRLKYHTLFSTLAFCR